MTGKYYLIAFKTLVYKEVNRFFRIWTQTLLPPAITTTLYFLVFGNLIGSHISLMGVAHHISYSQYIAPGLIMMAVINNAYANVSSSFYLSKFVKTIDGLLVSPMPNFLILFGYIFGGILRGVIVGIIVTIVALCFTHLSVHNIWITALVVLLASTFFSLAGFINAVYAKSFDDISIIPTFILTPLTYLGGVFYSINMLPHLWYTVSVFNPILYIVNLFRFGILGVSDVPIAGASIIISILLILLFLFAWYLLNKGVGIKT